MSEDLDLIAQAAREAGDIAVARRRLGLKIDNKPGGSPVTNGDLAVDAFLTERLRGARPDYGWLSEEAPDSAERLTKSRVFMIDPIDGTSAYMKDRAWWSVSIAVVENGRPVAGVVYAPDPDEFYEAAAGEGARLNGKPITVTNRADIEDAAMLGEARMFAREGWSPPWPRMRIEARNSVAYRMCLVASGAFDACIALSAKHDWDIAAADLIVAEAGGVATDHLGAPFDYNLPAAKQKSLVCAGPSMHPLLIDRVGHIEIRKPIQP
jgi:myo-inositol-1(or 4)-monophosphatase